ncbi:MAG TPA: enoyl-CoA hydratase/isomerase family protein [Desulfobacteraceae bacterium]|jgi:cyclohexa-1,5-dienecarbonyl-CoA hydratase|nr:enoyl-CoA hydratase/isomerase family protein [Desulfobacteraceae bacterium]
MDYQYIKTDATGGLGTITLSRPPLNVLNIAMMEEINDVLDSWREHPDLRIILMAAEGKCFSAGVDVGEHMGDMAPKMIEVFHRMFRLLDSVRIPTVASVFGSCLGGGFELAAFCDMVLASESASFGQPEIKVGVFPPIAAQLLPRIIGRKAAFEIIFSGRTMNAEEALSLGIVNKVVPDAELQEATAAFTSRFVKLSAEVLRHTKHAFNAGLRDDLEPSLKIIEDIYLNELMKSHDAAEGLKAFVEKRKPQWSHR